MGAVRLTRVGSTGRVQCARQQLAAHYKELQVKHNLHITMRANMSSHRQWKLQQQALTTKLRGHTSAGTSVRDSEKRAAATKPMNHRCDSITQHTNPPVAQRVEVVAQYPRLPRHQPAASHNTKIQQDTKHINKHQPTCCAACQNCCAGCPAARPPAYCPPSRTAPAPHSAQ